MSTETWRATETTETVRTTGRTTGTSRGKFFIRTFGCQMNEHDSERLAQIFSEKGMEQTACIDQADLVIVNTCCVRENADNKLYGYLGRLKFIRETNPNLVILVGGCLAQKDSQLIAAKAPFVDAVFGTHNLHRAYDLFELAQSNPAKPVVEIWDAQDEWWAPSPKSKSPWSAWVTIQVGCNNSCTFCIVPFVRGAEVSKPLDTIVDEVSSLASEGVVEVTLLGQNVNSYGRDITKRKPLFDQLLKAVGSINGIQRIRFTSPHPKDISHSTIRAMADTPSVCEHLHLPLQSGSNRILAAMHRGYTRERYIERLSDARQAISDLAVTTDIIVGFPTETEKDFEETLEVVAEAEYDGAYSFIFSPRPATKAAEMDGDFVPPEVCLSRYERLQVVLSHSSYKKHHERVGRLEEVLVEGRSQRNPNLFTGRTRQNKLVHFGGDDLVTAGSTLLVRITDATSHYLLGEQEK